LGNAVTNTLTRVLGGKYRNVSEGFTIQDWERSKYLVGEGRYLCHIFNALIFSYIDCVWLAEQRIALCANCLIWPDERYHFWWSAMNYQWTTLHATCQNIVCDSKYFQLCLSVTFRSLFCNFLPLLESFCKFKSFHSSLELEHNRVMKWRGSFSRIREKVYELKKFPREGAINSLGNWLTLMVT
jgi:hypothetical protein